MLRSESILCWEIESTRRQAPAASTWRSFGRVDEWTDLGPRNAIFRDVIAGAGREADQIGFEGVQYTGTIGPFQVVDPRVLGFWWGQEVSAPVQIGATSFYRHTVTPTTNGALPSKSVQMRDRQIASPSRTDKTTFLETITRRLTLRGERPNEDGSGGRLMAALDELAHDDDDTVADKGVTLPSTLPYRYTHGNISLWGEQVFRIEDWEFVGDANAESNHYWQDTNANKPYETPPGNSMAEFRCNLIADGELYSTGGGVDEYVRQINKNRRLGNGTLLFRVTPNQNEFQLDLTDIALPDALKTRPGSGKVRYKANGFVRKTAMSWVDNSSTRFFPS